MMSAGTESAWTGYTGTCLEFAARQCFRAFALGRTIGWIGHSIEQYQANQVIRPRARYIGPLPHKQD